MDIIGVVAEYNPFHNGHLYQINKIRELYPNSIISFAVFIRFLNIDFSSTIFMFGKSLKPSNT